MADQEKEKPAAGAETETVSAPTATDKVELRPQLLADQPLSDRWKSWWTRIGWSLVLVGSFCVIIALGHLYLALLVLLIEHLCFYEIMNIAFKINKAVEEQMKEDGATSSAIPLFRTISMWFLFTANYYAFARGFYMQLHELVSSHHMKEAIDKAVRHHQFIAFCLYIAGIVAFVLTLRKGHYRRQFSNFGWTHVSCLIVVGGASFIVGNIYEGLIWFLLPVFIVICNDCTAYIFGFFFGHTPLIELSPKKTWEGFLGAFASTMAFAWLASYFFAQYEFFRCPVSHTYKHGQLPSFYPMYDSLHCEPEYVFTTRAYEVPAELSFLGVDIITAYPCQLHALMLALFGSLIAPFGGFMASGFKRAFKVKDFSDLIPGHGGVMDRFDCQFLMGAFTYVYYQSFINPTLTMVPFERIGEMVSELSMERKMQLYNMLKESLTKDGAM